MRRRKFSREFKVEAVKLVKEPGSSGDRNRPRSPLGPPKESAQHEMTVSNDSIAAARHHKYPCLPRQS
jgi:transposase-like protein